MTNHSIARFLPTGGTAHCYGANHRDEGRIGICASCLSVIVKTDKGLYDLHQRINAAGNPAYDYACWSLAHICDPAQVERIAQQRAADIAAGELVLGQRVRVIRGRKVAKGTEGTYVWQAKDIDFNGNDYTKAGLKDDTGTMYYIRKDYLEVVTTLAQEDTQAPAKRGSHANCNHPSTPTARAACRRARS
jgi:uncharacterized protein YdbL (DUF1318 family)